MLAFSIKMLSVLKVIKIFSLIALPSSERQKNQLVIYFFCRYVCFKMRLSVVGMGVI